MERGIPWSVFRVISDRADDGSVDDEVFHLSNQDGTPNPKAIAAYFLRHPGRIPLMTRMGREVKVATRRRRRCGDRRACELGELTPRIGAPSAGAGAESEAADGARARRRGAGSWRLRSRAPRVRSRSSVTADTDWTPPTLRTYCLAAACTSSGVAAGSRPRRVVMFRHMDATLRRAGSARARAPVPRAHDGDRALRCFVLLSQVVDRRWPTRAFEPLAVATLLLRAACRTQPVSLSGSGPEQPLAARTQD